MTDDIPESDRIPGAPHPRVTPQVFGHDAAEARILDAFNAGRLHHAWLISGPEGIGKATLAWRIARFLLTAPDRESGLFGAPEPVVSLDTDPDHPVARRVAALSEPRLFLLRRPWDDKTEKLKQDIPVDEVRRMKGFFQLTATEGGPRVALIDAADDLNPSGANALLKLLEEPPPETTFLIVTHRPSGLLPTIRSRCRDLRLSPLAAPDLDAALSGAGLTDPAGPASPRSRAGPSAPPSFCKLRKVWRSTPVSPTCSPPCPGWTARRRSPSPTAPPSAGRMRRPTSSSPSRSPCLPVSPARGQPALSRPKPPPARLRC
jgi:DNA polymerase III subunit delta'